jgi:tRNA/rRNA methyltransferase
VRVVKNVRFRLALCFQSEKQKKRLSIILLRRTHEMSVFETRAEGQASHLAPIIILVGPQMGENIGAVARAMANFGLSELRLVAPRDGWPNPLAYPTASGADQILDEAKVFGTTQEAISDLACVYATTARSRDQKKPSFTVYEAMEEASQKATNGQNIGILFGCERAGLSNSDISYANAIIHIPTNPKFSSINLAQAVLLASHEWFRQQGTTSKPQKVTEPPANRGEVIAFLDFTEKALTEVGFFRPPEKQEIMAINMRNILQRLCDSQQDVRTMFGALSALYKGKIESQKTP